MVEDLSAEELQRLLPLVDFLEPLSEGALRDLAQSARCTSLNAGDAFVVGPEEHGEQMLLLLRGQVQVYETDPSGRELTIATLDYGVPVGATGLASHRMREVCVRALGPSMVGRLHCQDLEETIRKEPEAGLTLAQLLGRRLVWMEARWADLASKNVTARLASVLLLLFESEGVVTPEGYRISTRYTHRQLATMIGANREAATRALGKRRQEGAVQLRKRYIYVADMEILKRASV